MLPTMAGAAHRCVIPEHEFDIERLAELLLEDRAENPSNYAIVLVSEGAMFEGGDMVFESDARDAFGHAKLGGIGDRVAHRLKEISRGPRYDRPVNTLSQKLGYLARSGDPDAVDSIVPMAYGNLALDLIRSSSHGRLVALRDGRYADVPIDVVTSTSKVVDVESDYDADRLRPSYRSFSGRSFFPMSSEG